jgi:Leucine-rich repeat (LRR) protein
VGNAILTNAILTKSLCCGIGRASLRLHRSTYVMAMLILVVLLMANLPGTILLDGKDWSDQEGIYVAHGWPWTFLFRGLDRTAFLKVEPNVRWPYWLPPHPMEQVPGSLFWKISDKVKTISVLPLLADFTVCAVITIALTSVYEVWRRRRRRWCQFYLSELFAMITLASLLLAWLSVEAAEGNEEKQAVSEMIGGAERSPLVCGVSLAGPQWIRNLFGDAPFEVFDRIRMVDMPANSTRGTPHFYRDLNRPENLSHLRYVDHLSLLQRRRSANLLRYLARPDRVVQLAFVASDDEGLLDVQRFRNVVQLAIMFPDHAPLRQQTIASLDSLTGLSRLRDLTIYGADITDAGLRQIANLKGLQILRLDGPRISEAGMECLSKLENLEALDISGTTADHGLSALKKLTRLRHLTLPWKLVDSKAATDLKNALPDCDLK